MSTALNAPPRSRVWASTISASAALVMSVIPGLSFVAWIPAIAALVLGIVALARRSRPAPAIIGIALGMVAWIIAIAVSVNTLTGLGRPPVQSEIVPLIRQSDTPSAPPVPSEVPEVVVEEEPEPEAVEPEAPMPVAPAPAVPAPPPAPVAPPPAPVAPPPAPAPPPPPAPAAPPPAAVSYKNCTEARAAGASPVHRGDPGYGKHLDRDGDGVGCE